jgi:hypothetical protein
MEPFARKLALPYRREDLAVPARTEAQLDLVLAWARRDEQLLEQWGFAARAIDFPLSGE